MFKIRRSLFARAGATFVAGTLLGSLLCLAPGAASALPGKQNELPEACQGVNGAAYVSNELASLALPPPTDFPNSVGAYASNWLLRLCPPQIVAPPDKTGAEGYEPVSSSATSADTEMANPFPDDPSCYAEIRQRTRGNYDNVLGGPIYDGDWGELGGPQLYHFNTSAYARILGSAPPDDPSTDYDESLDDYRRTSGGLLKLPVGRNSLRYRADTLVSPLDFVYLYIPKVPQGTKLYKKMVESSSKFRRFVFKGYQALAGATEVVTFPGVDYPIDKVIGQSFRHSQLGVIDDVYNEDSQEVWVYDRIPPVLTTSTDVSSLPENIRAVLSYDADRDVFYLEAIHPGGIRARTGTEFLSRLLSYHDHCDRQVQLSSDGGGQQFWPTGGSINLVWTATDPGPRDSTGAGNSVDLTENIEVRDSYPPVLLAPPSQVHELPASDPDGQVQIDLGSPRVYDLADLEPDVGNDASSDLFGLGLTEVTWTASDGFNTSQAVQLINVKEEGTNTPPVADPQSVETRSFEETEIVLTGSDADYHSSVDRYDPLTFNIVSNPQHGTFVAPLLPYFIDDYRLDASALKFDGLPWQQDPLQYCNDYNDGNAAPGDPKRWQMEYPYDPTWMTVDDDGNTIVHDRGDMDCLVDGLSSQYRFAIFDANHTLVTHSDTLSFGGSPTDIFWDPETDRIFVTVRDNSDDDHIYVYNPDLTQIADYNLGTGSASPWFLENPVSIAVDTRGIMYVAGSSYVNAYRQIDGLAQIDSADAYLGRVYDPSGGTDIQSVATDSQNNLYVSFSDRIVKVEASQIDTIGNFAAGALVGWLGYCSSNLTSEYACDTPNRRSLGFSCSDALCGRDAIYGDQPGQFNEAQGIAVDPNDILYVSDFGNSRVQRFTPDGFFAGEAKSTGVGYGFLLGDFGNPDDIEVNSEHFYILNRDADLLHIFATTPLEPIDDASARVVYRSDDNYTGTDQFRFGVTDGFDSSEADVTIQVTRNFRPPEVPDSGLDYQVGPSLEDQPAAFTVPGTDPDGDALTAMIVEPPEHGTVDFDGLDATYTPEENYNGTDIFSYRVFDGVDSSGQIGQVSLTVDPVEDPPSIEAQATGNVNRGFRLAHRVDVRDPDDGDTLLVTIDWGDGTTTDEGHFELDGAAIPPEDAWNADGTVRDGVETTGPILNVDTQGRGVLLADHVYTVAGVYNVQSCVYDGADVDAVTQVKSITGASQQSCAVTEITVGDAAELLLEVAGGESAQAPGSDIDFVVTAHDLPYDLDSSDPRFGQLPAAGVAIVSLSLNGELADGLELLGASGPDATCTTTGNEFSCAVQQLDYDSDTALTVSARIADNAPGGRRLTLAVEGTWPDMREAAEGGGYVEVEASGLAPALDDISPGNGKTEGYTEVTLTGAHFDSGAKVYFGDIEAMLVDVVDSASVTALTPPQSAGAVDVRIVNPDDQSAAKSGAWTYQDPAPPSGGGGSGGGTGGGSSGGSGGGSGGASGGGSSSGGGGGATGPLWLLVMLIGWACRRREWRLRRNNTEATR
jgi:hypothetical protein